LSILLKTGSSSSGERRRVQWGLADALFVVAVAVGFQLAVVWVVTNLARYWPTAGYYLALDRSGDILTKLVIYFFYFMPGFGALLWALRSSRSSWRDLGWRGFKALDAAVYISTGLVVLELAGALMPVLLQALGLNAYQVQQNFLTRIAPTHHILAFITLVILPPLVEESVFRGFLFPVMAKKWGVAWGAIASSALFGLAHWQINVSVYTFAMGVILCIMYTKLKSIFPGMMLHMLNNYLAFLALSQK